MKFILLTFICLLFAGTGISGQNHTSMADIQAIRATEIDLKATGEFRKFNFGKRLFVSQQVLVSTSVPALTSLFIINGGGLKNMKNYVSYDQFSDSWSRMPVWDYDDAFYNYGVHPYMGSMVYLVSRNRGGNRFESFCIAALGTLSFEYLIESFNQNPSINDLVITPIGGAIAGEISYLLVKKMKSNGHLNLFEKIGVTILDPVDFACSGFSYRKMLRRGTGMPGSPQH